MSLKSIWQRRANERGFIVKTVAGDIRVAVDPAMEKGTVKFKIVAHPKSIVYINIDDVKVV